MLTFELDPDGSQLHVHADAAGVTLLMTQLRSLAEAGKSGHAHLMTPEWSGTELTSEKQDPAATLLNKVTIHLWSSAG